MLLVLLNVLNLTMTDSFSKKHGQNNPAQCDLGLAHSL